MLLTSHRFFFGMAHYAILVFRWRVNRVEFKVHELRGVDHIMPSTCWDYNSVSILDTVFYTVNNHFSFSFLKSKELINILMRFFTNFFTRLNAHKHELTVLPCVQHTAEISVLLSSFLNVDYVSLQVYHLDLLQHSIPYQVFCTRDQGKNLNTII